MTAKHKPIGGPVPSEILKTLLCQIDDALIALAKSTPMTDENIHQTRKTLKRARANLRLLRSTVDKRLYARENARLRDAARLLAPIRDVQAALNTIATLPTRESSVARGALLRMLKARLLKSHAALHGAFQDGNVAQQATQMLNDSRIYTARWRTPDDDAAALHTDLKRIYRRGRNALANVTTSCTDENLHELRKQVKYLWHALDALHQAGAKHLSRAARSAESIADCLGDDHDLALIRETISAVDRNPRTTDAELHAHLEQRRGKLQSDALKLSRRLYAQRPGAWSCLTKL